jgi:thiamine-phosphate pyrophosphorylase
MLVSDRRHLGERSFDSVALAAVAGHATSIQVREKDLPARELLSLVQSLVRQLPTSIPIIVNDRVDVALAAGAQGVQLGADSLPVSVARAIAPNLLIGASVHGVAEAVRAETQGASFLIVGTMFETQSHPGKLPEGLTLLREIRSQVRIPLLGIGGITSANASSVMEAGADGVAVISEILTAEDPEAAARHLWRAVQ